MFYMYVSYAKALVRDYPFASMVVVWSLGWFFGASAEQGGWASPEVLLSAPART